jgi:hypothetical protein
MGFSPLLYKINNGDMKPARSLDVRAVLLYRLSSTRTGGFAVCWVTSWRWDIPLMCEDLTSSSTGLCGSPALVDAFS